MSQIDTTKLTEMIEFAEAFTKAEMLMLKWIDTELPENVAMECDAAVCFGRFRDGDEELYEAWVELLHEDNVYMIDASTTFVHSDSRVTALQVLCTLIEQDLEEHMWAQSRCRFLIDDGPINWTK